MHTINEATRCLQGEKHKHELCLGHTGDTQNQILLKIKTHKSTNAQLDSYPTLLPCKENPGDPEPAKWALLKETRLVRSKSYRVSKEADGDCLGQCAYDSRVAIVISWRIQLLIG